jgi:hypothetical protein
MRLLRWCWILIFLVAIGCGDGRVRLPTGTVSGVVTYQGSPLTGGRVLFAHSTGQAAGADIASDGSFKLLAFQGNNRVAIFCFQSINDPSGKIYGIPPREPVKSLIPDRYTEPANSGLTFDVKSGEDNRAQFTLQD